MNNDILSLSGRWWDDAPRAYGWDHAPRGYEWDHLSYRVRVRASNSPVYLWGSAQITSLITFPTALLFHFINDPVGQPITFGTTPPGAATPIGTLQPGECVSIPLQPIAGQTTGGIAGVWASCQTTVTTIRCFLKT
jgi:hypothetical protein